ncbi:unnamed protein product [Adineta steineri]|uniref:Multifunctional fusion protein n=1 Tax=Adineta steineri TaxID=433720 RepID=A0A819XPX3_9BILA|nr:unnamed protein product [Adineta steineri]
MASADDLNQLEPTFMYTQIFKDILLDMEHSELAIKQFAAYCRNNNSVSPINIDRFENEYHAQLAIWWYTSSSNIYSMLNYALRSMEGDTIINMGFFIHDLHHEIQQLHEQQVNSYNGKPFLVYRGQGLSETDFEKLKKTQGGLISFNNFLSTSTNQDIALILADSASENADMAGILFIMSIDPCIKSAPFASIKEKSCFGEENEILFSMHTVFRVNTVKQMDNKNQLYQVELQLTSDDDGQLRLLTDRIREEVTRGTGWQRLSSLLLTIGQFNKAEKFCKVLLEQTSDESEKAFYYGCLGYVKDEQGDYEKAICYYKQGLDMYQKTLPSDHPLLATSYNNIGIVYNNIGESSKALSYYEKALEIKQKALPSNHPSLATSYNNIGFVYDNMGDYAKALSFYEKALEIYQKTLPSNHPDLATSYSNIGNEYNKMGEYSKALSYYEKALEIFHKNFPSNHPLLATSYNHIGSVYSAMGQYTKALSFYKKALEMFEETLPSNHSSLANSYCRIGSAYHEMGQYTKALLFHEKALEIFEKSLPSDHLSLATSYGHIGTVHGRMGEYSKALSYYEKALKIREKTLPTNHSSLATSYCRIGSTYLNMKEYSEALLSYEKALEIREKALPSNHPDIKAVKKNLKLLKRNYKEHFINK